MAETYGNFYLNMDQMIGNAEILWGYKQLAGWTKNAMCGMLGNMQSESTINPGIWQSLNAGNMRGGFGLVQWTPATNYINWAINSGWTTYNAYGRLNPQHLRIEYELDNGLQWIATSEYPISFRQFTQSLESPEYLASAFLKCYERAGVEVEEQRRRQAREWWERLGGGVIPPEPGRNKGRLPIWAYFPF